MRLPLPEAEAAERDERNTTVMTDNVKMAMGRRKDIVLVAHDNKKQDLMDCTRFN
jgi:hypothetical protein